MNSKITKQIHCINVKGSVLSLQKPVIMGILNITHDSFFENSRVLSESELISKANTMLKAGAAILDVGAFSTRPNFKKIEIDEESTKICWTIEILKKHFPEVPISVDTFRAEVAEKAVIAGASIINDVCGGNADEKMFETVAKLNVPYVLTHNRGSIDNMHHQQHYNNLTLDIIKELEHKVFLLRQLKVKDIIIDPGFGFSKNINQNFELLKKLELLNILELPILIGLSRKSMIYKTLEIDADHALNGTSVLNTIAISKGANILRVHDVKEAKEVIDLCSKIF